MKKRVRLPYTPTERQLAFHRATEDEVLYGGAAGGGKSTAVVMDAFLRCWKHPGTKAYLFRRTYRELEDTLIAQALRLIPPQVRAYSASAHEMRLCNGSQLRFRHCQREDDRFLYQGAEIHWLYIDELTHFTKGIYDYLRSRLRAETRLKIHPVARLTANPGGVGHGWVKARFVDPMPPDTTLTAKVEIGTYRGERTRRYIPARLNDNPHIAPEYVAELAEKPRALREALLYGKWDAFEGQMLDGFVNDPAHYQDRLHTHVIEPFEIPPHWRRFRSFDFGYSKPFSVGWWAVDPDGIVYRYREWYGCTGTPNEGLRITPRQIAIGIKEREKLYEGGLYVTGIADPSIWDGSRGICVAEQMLKEGVAFIPAENARLPGLMQVLERLRFDQNGVPGAYVFSTCRDTLRTLPALSRDTVNVEDVNTDGEDHIYDEWRYFLMAHPLPLGGGRRGKRYSPLD